MPGRFSVGAAPVGAGGEDSTLAATATIVVSGRAFLSRATAQGAVAVDESDRIVIEPTWPTIEVDLTLDVSLL